MSNQHLTLKCIDSYIEPLLRRVLQAERLGVCLGRIELDSISSSCDKSKGDRFELSIPYADHTLLWNVYFDSQCPEVGPDFIFGDETFLADPDIDILTTLVPSLVAWDPTDDAALLKVLGELLTCYKQHQIELLAKLEDRLHLEFSTLVGETETCIEDVEMILLPVGMKPMEARFLIRMAIDLTQLPTRNRQSQSYIAVLQVTFHAPDWNRIATQLILSKNLEEYFSGTSNLIIPPFTPDKCLMDYVPEVKKYISEKVKSLTLAYEKRRRFISALIFMQRGSVVEFDAIEFSHIVICLEHRDFHFLIHFYLSTNFPEEKPQIMLQSVYHMTPYGKLYTEVLDNTPYSPRWEPVEMITKIMAYIIEDVISKFQMNSVKQSSY